MILLANLTDEQDTLLQTLIRHRFDQLHPTNILSETELIELADVLGFEQLSLEMTRDSLIPRIKK